MMIEICLKIINNKYIELKSSLGIKFIKVNMSKKKNLKF